MPNDKRLSKSLWMRVAGRRVGGDHPPDLSVKPSVPDKEPPTAPIDLLAFARRLKGALDQQGGVTAGTIQIINLDSVRHALGDRWPRLADRVASLADMVINRRTERHDMVTRLDGPLFLIVFTRLDAAGAKAKCAMIAEEIERHLLGWSADFKAVRVGAAVARLTAQEVTLERLDVKGEVARALCQAAKAFSPCAQASVPTANVGEIAEPSVKADPDGSWTTVPPSPSSAAPACERFTDWYYEDRKVTISEITFRYWPVWHVRRRAIGTFLCMPTVPMGRDCVLVGSRTMADISPQLVAEIDRLGLVRVSGDIQSLAANDQRALVSAPVHFETLATLRLRKDYLAVCANLPTIVRRHLILELVGLPDGTPEGRVIELLNVVRQFCLAINVRVRLTETRFAALVGARVHAVGAALDEKEEEGDEGDLFRRMNDFTTSAEKANLKTYLHGSPSRSLSVAALCSGFDYVAGDGLATAVGTPDPAYRFNAIDLYSALLGNRG
ncbi:MAG: hypothetical protein Q7R40_04815 [Phaeospirillum sp.]|nr:hypothetical protein [Phaeospirillum sp.]